MINSRRKKNVAKYKFVCLMIVLLAADDDWHANSCAVNWHGNLTAKSGSIAFSDFASLICWDCSKVVLPNIIGIYACNWAREEFSKIELCEYFYFWINMILCSIFSRINKLKRMPSLPKCKTLSRKVSFFLRFVRVCVCVLSVSSVYGLIDYNSHLIFNTS